MPRLKDYFDPDLEIFFDLDEFAEVHTVNGESMPVIIDDDALKEAQANQADGVFRAEIAFMVKKEDFGSLPAVGQIVTFDSRRTLRVIDATEDTGVYTIILGANRS